MRWAWILPPPAASRQPSAARMPAAGRCNLGCLHRSSAQQRTARVAYIGAHCAPRFALAVARVSSCCRTAAVGLQDQAASTAIARLVHAGSRQRVVPGWRPKPTCRRRAQSALRATCTSMRRRSSGSCALGAISICVDQPRSRQAVRSWSTQRLTSGASGVAASRRSLIGARWPARRWRSIHSPGVLDSGNNCIAAADAARCRAVSDVASLLADIGFGAAASADIAAVSSACRRCAAGAFSGAVFGGVRDSSPEG